jgi:hypothetical protein
MLSKSLVGIDRVCNLSGMRSHRMLSNYDVIPSDS